MDLTSRPFVIVRRIACPSCGADLGLTVAEVDRGVTTCDRCRNRLELRAGELGDGPHRTMTVLAPRVLLPGPPTGRILETRGDAPCLVIRQERGPQRLRDLILVVGGLPVWVVCLIHVYTAPGLSSLLARLNGCERLAIVGGEVVHRDLGGGVHTLRVRDMVSIAIDRDEVVLRGRRFDQELRVADRLLGHARPTLEWIVAWLHERVAEDAARRAP